MDTMALLPTADAIPTPWGWFETLSLLTFCVHLLCVNVVLGGACLALAVRDRVGTPDGPPDSALPTVLGLAINMGVPPLLFLQVLYGQFFYTASVLSAWFLVGVAGLTMAAYFLLYVNAWRVKRHVSRSGPVLLAACLLLLAVSFILSNVMTLMIAPGTWTRYFDNPGGWLLNLRDPTLWPRWLHFVLASLAVGGLTLALTNAKSGSRGDLEARRRTALGLRWFTRSTLAQLAVGCWFVVALPREVALLFLGRSGLHTGLFALALVGVALVLWFALHKRAVAAAFALAPVILLMASLRELVKAASVAQVFSPARLEVTGQYGPMILFFVSLGASVWGMAHMAGLYRKARGGR